MGSLGRVHLGIDKRTKIKYAVKTYNLFVLKKKRQIIRTKDGGRVITDKLKEVMSEIDILKKMDHENVIKLRKLMKDEDKEELYIVMNYVSHGQLLKWNTKKL